MQLPEVFMRLTEILRKVPTRAIVGLGSALLLSGAVITYKYTASQSEKQQSVEQTSQPTPGVRQKRVHHKMAGHSAHRRSASRHTARHTTKKTKDAQLKQAKQQKKKKGHGFSLFHHKKHKKETSNTTQS